MATVRISVFNSVTCNKLVNKNQVSLTSFHGGVVEDSVLLGKYCRLTGQSVPDFTKKYSAFEMSETHFSMTRRLIREELKPRIRNNFVNRVRG
jgi:hypothetical protein